MMNPLAQGGGSPLDSRSAHGRVSYDMFQEQQV